MVSDNSFSSSNRSPKFSNPFTTRIFSDVAGDITIVVDGESFLLHKFPLVSRSGKIRRMVAEAAKDSNESKIELVDVPGGPASFELAMKFCYGMNFEITPANVARLRCAAQYLEMTEACREENLVRRAEAYLDDVVARSLEKSIEVLAACARLPALAEDVGIPRRCVEAIAINAGKEQLVSGLSRLDRERDDPSEPKGTCPDWWIEDLSALRIDFYARVICAMSRAGVRQDSIVASLMHYAQTSLRVWNRTAGAGPGPAPAAQEQCSVVEALTGLIPHEKAVPLSFLFGMLKTAILLDAAAGCRLELERRIALRLETVSLDDLLIPAVKPGGDALFDVDAVHRVLVNFLRRIEEEEEEEESDECGYESESGGIGASPSHGALLKVGRLVDAYLAEIAPDPYLSLQKFNALIEILPDYARVIDDGLYRAVDIYLKAHPMLTELECKKLCKFIDCGKLSQEASNHAAQNERLPVQMLVKVLYFEQLRLKSTMSGSSGGGDGGLLLSQRMSSGVPSAAMSPRDNYASLRRENRELKLEISRMRVRLSELEKEQLCMKQGMIDKTGNGKTFLTSISKGIGRIGIFGGPSGGGKRQKSGRKSRGSEGKSGRSRRHSVS